MRLKKKKKLWENPATRIWIGYYCFFVFLLCLSTIFHWTIIFAENLSKKLRLEVFAWKKSVARKLMQIILINMAAMQINDTISPWLFILFSLKDQTFDDLSYYLFEKYMIT